jgi:hypothetical protein
MNIKSLTIIVIFICAFSIQAQTIKPLEEQYDTAPMSKNNVYYKDVNNILDKYFGTWVYQDATHYLKITFFKKEQKRMNGNKDWYFDELVCEYQYKKDGVEIYNTYGVNSNVNSYIANRILGDVIISDNKIELRYGEPPINSCSRTKSGNLKLEYLTNTSGSQPQIHWQRTNHLTETSLKCNDGSSRDSSDFQIPTGIILTKE